MDAAEKLLAQLASGSAAELEKRLLQALDSGSPAVLFCNVHMLMLAGDDPELARAMRAAQLLIPDGVPLAWLQRRLGIGGAEVLRGYQSVQPACEQAVRLGRPVGLLGSTDEVLDALQRRLVRDHQGLEIAYRHAPPFGEGAALDLDDAMASEINRLGLHCLFVGLGCPKQEKWIHRHAARLECALLGVGAAFGWLAGTSRMPPLWMERGGLGWLHRLFEDPARMWHRYLIYNTKFLVFSARQLVGRRRLAPGRPPE